MIGARYEYYDWFSLLCTINMHVLIVHDRVPMTWTGPGGGTLTTFEKLLPGTGYTKCFDVSTQQK